MSGLKSNIKLLLNSIIYSYSSIYFSYRLWLGILLAALSFCNTDAGFMGSASVILVNLFALVLSFDKNKIACGYYGFNAVLTGLAIGVVFGVNSFSIFMLFASCLLILFTSLLLDGVLQKYNLPFLSIPFLITLWIVMLTSQLTDNLSAFGISAKCCYNTLWFENLNNTILSSVALPETIKDFFLSISYILFQDNIVNGILISAALFLNSKSSFIFCFINYIFAHLLFENINTDIFNMDFHQIGFNFIFTSMAIGCYYILPSKKSMLWTVVLIPIQFLFIFAGTRLLSYFYLPVYSLSFCATSILFLYTVKINKSVLNPQIADWIESTPEKTLYNSSVNKNRLKYYLFTPIKLPFLGYWTISQGQNGKETHKKDWQNAWDFKIYDENNKEYENEGLELTDYFCYGKPILSPGFGEVVALESGIEDNIIGQDNQTNNWGNYVIIKHNENLFSVLCHLKKNSVKCKIGDIVKNGDTLAQCGNSGHSLYPHLHFQLQQTSQIGAKTIQYPISSYIRQLGTLNIAVLDGIPSEKECISNTNNKAEIGKYFTLNRYESLEVKFGNQNDSWESKTDCYGYTYLEDSNGNKAWYFTSENFFKFIKYEGRKSGPLYHFYLSAYTVVYHTKELSYTDEISISSIKYNCKKFLQDIICFAARIYRLSYSYRTANTDNNQITYESSVHETFFGQRVSLFAYKTIILDDNLLKISINDNNSHIWEMTIMGKWF